MILILMGVCGTGKTTVGGLLARELGWQFADADDYHPPANRAKMRDGTALNDSDRRPWLQSLHRLLDEWRQSHTSGVMACSALKASYREALRGAFAPDEVRFAFFDGPPELIASRLAGRSHAYMNDSLLESQLATLELPAKGEVWRVSIEDTPQAICDELASRLRELISLKEKVSL